jgi:hypothetical protein
MSRYDYETSKRLLANGENISFDALLMALMRKADSYNIDKLQQGWPHVWEELEARYEAPGGLIPGDSGYEELQEQLRQVGEPPWR